MVILILETSCEKGCLVVAENGHVIRTKPLVGGPSLSKTLALECQTLLEGQNPSCIAVGVGPGSYTGIRVSAALAQALAYGWNIPLIGFCSLMAFGPPPVLIDAKSGGFYALFDKIPEIVAPSDPRLQNISNLSSPHPEIIRKRLDCPAIYRETNPDPALLAELTFKLFLEGGSKPFELNYLSFP